MRRNTTPRPSVPRSAWPPAPKRRRPRPLNHLARAARRARHD